MGEFASIVTDVLRWVVPVTGLLLMLLAWKRFGSSGARLAAAGFGVMLGSLLLRETILRVLRPEFGFTARDAGLILTVTGVAGLAGFVVIVFAIRRMIASAEAAESLELSAGDGE